MYKNCSQQTCVKPSRRTIMIIAEEMKKKNKWSLQKRVKT